MVCDVAIVAYIQPELLVALEAVQRLPRGHLKNDSNINEQNSIPG